MVLLRETTCKDEGSYLSWVNLYPMRVTDDTPRVTDSVLDVHNIYVPFRKRDTDYRTLLQKHTNKDKTFYESWPTCTEYNDIQWVTNSVLDLHNVYQVSLRKRTTDYKSLLKQSTYKDKNGMIFNESPTLC